MSALNQTFPIFYNNQKILVDPSLMYTSSAKFAELCHPYTSRGITKLQLTIANTNFTERSINNFLNLCQNLPTDVRDSEMVEICEIAKLFKANQIYNTGSNFIKSKVDSNFFIPDNKYDNVQILFISEENSAPNQYPGQPDFDFESDDEENEQQQPPQHSSKPSDDKVMPALYEIRIERPMMKCNRYYFSQNGRPLFAAKKKNHDLVIGQGSEVHFGSIKSNHVGTIEQEQMYNKIHIDNQNIILRYVRCPDSGATTMDVNFLHGDQHLFWIGKHPQLNAKTGTYGLKLRGAYKHTPITSKRNAALRNSEGKTTFVVRKMRENFYEAECHPSIAPSIAFAIALSSIVGPNIDQAIQGGVYGPGYHT